MAIKNYSYKILFFLFLVLFSSSTNNDIDKIIAIVGDNIILRSELELEIAQQIISGNQVDQKERCNILKRLVTQKILVKQALIDSILVEDNQVEAEVGRRLNIMTKRAGSEERLIEFLGKSLFKYKEDIKSDVKEQMVAGRMEQEIISGLSVSPQEVKDHYYSLSQDDLPFIDTTYQIGEIVIKPKLSFDEKSFYRDKIEKIRSRVVKGEDFSTLARLYSDDLASAEQGGDLGYIQKNDVVEAFAFNAFKLLEGQLSPVFETEFGFHFLEVLERKGDLVRVRHILVKYLMTNQSLNRVKKTIEKIYNSVVVEKTISFPQAVALYSQENNSKQNGGFLAYQSKSGIHAKIPTKNLDPKVYKIIKDIPAGSYSKPSIIYDARNEPVYKFFYVKEIIPPHKMNVEQDYHLIAQKAKASKIEVKLSQWFEKRRKFTFIKIDKAFNSCRELNKWNNSNN